MNESSSYKAVAAGEQWVVCPISKFCSVGLYRAAPADVGSGLLLGIRRCFRSLDLANCQLKKASDRRALQVIVLAEREMTDQLAIARKKMIGIGEKSAAIKAQIDVVSVGHHMAKAVFERLAGERETDGNCVAIDEGLDRLRCFFEHDVAKREGEARDVRIIGSKVAQQLSIGRSRHDEESNMIGFAPTPVPFEAE